MFGAGWGSVRLHLSLQSSGCLSLLLSSAPAPYWRGYLFAPVPSCPGQVFSPSLLLPPVPSLLSGWQARDLPTTWLPPAFLLPGPHLSLASCPLSALPGFSPPLHLPSSLPITISCARPSSAPHGLSSLSLCTLPLLSASLSLPLCPSLPSFSICVSSQSCLPLALSPPPLPPFPSLP